MFALISEHVERACRVMLDSLAFCPDDPTGFRDLAAGVVSEHVLRLATHASGPGPPWLLLPILTCEAVVEEDRGSGGPMETALHVAAAWELGNLAAGALDAWQDGDTDNALWKRVGAKPAVNLAVGLIALSLRILSNLAEVELLSAAAVLDVKRGFEETLLQMVAGQHADLVDDLSLDDYQTVTRAKTGSLFRLAAWSGARVAGADDAAAELYGVFGEDLGLLIQVWNDLYGLEGIMGKQDAGHRRTLPILAALEMGREGRLAESEVEDPSGLKQAGRLYALTQAGLLHREATDALARCPAPGRLSLFLDAYSVQQLVRDRQDPHA
jgi:hypothetical protein